PVLHGVAGAVVVVPAGHARQGGGVRGDVDALLEQRLGVAAGGGVPAGTAALELDDHLVAGAGDHEEGVLGAARADGGAARADGVGLVELEILEACRDGGAAVAAGPGLGDGRVGGGAGV